MTIEEIFGANATQDSDFLNINIADLPVTDKSKAQYLLAGIIFNLLEISFNTEVRVLIIQPKIIENQQTRYMAITIQFWAEE